MNVNVKRLGLQAVGQATDGDGLYHGVVFDTVQGALSAETRLLDTAKWNGTVAEQAGVARNHAGFQGFGNGVDCVDVFGKHVGGKPQAGVVGVGDHLFQSVEGDDGAQRTKGFLRGYLCRLGHVCEDGWEVEVGAEVWATAASNENLCTLGDGVFDVELNLFHGVGVDQTAVGGVWLEAVAEHKAAGLFCQTGRELVDDGGVHV